MTDSVKPGPHWVRGRPTPPIGSLGEQLRRALCGYPVRLWDDDRQQALLVTLRDDPEFRRSIRALLLGGAP